MAFQQRHSFAGPGRKLQSGEYPKRRCRGQHELRSPMQKEFFSRQRLRQRGQTIILVAISLVSLLGMAVLAIDVVTLYVASSEIQRAADAAALAGAKAIADSSVTTLLVTDPNVATIQGWVVSNAATPQINAVLQNNLIAGAAANL